jgi:arginine:ornithine antiporter/lysine permease
VPYLLVAAYGVRLAWTGAAYAGQPADRKLDLVRAAVAAVYAVGMIYAGGAKFLLLSALIYAPGTLLFVLARREQRRSVFTLAERPVFGCVALAAGVALYGLATGTRSV